MPMPRTPEPEVMDLADEAAAYAQADFSDVNAAFVERLLVLAGDRAQARAVDLGTGPGDIAIRVAQARPAWRVCGIDASDAMLAHARAASQAAGVDIEWLLADAKDLPLPSGSVDVLFTNSILHHLNDTATFWHQVRQSCKAGSTILLRDLFRPDSEPTARAIVQEYAGNESELLQEEFFRSLLAAYTVDEIRVQLAQAGLAQLHVETITDRHVEVWGTM